MLCIKLEDKISYTKALERAKAVRVSSFLKRAKLKWDGNVFAMEDIRIPKQFLFSEIADGSRKRGRRKRGYKDTLKDSFRYCRNDPETWEQSASDRPAWWHQVLTGINSYVKSRIAKKKEQRRRRRRKE